MPDTWWTLTCGYGLRRTGQTGADLRICETERAIPQSAWPMQHICFGRAARNLVGVGEVAARTHPASVQG